MKRWITALASGAALTLMALAPAAAADNSPVTIALVHGLSGSPLAAYSKQTTNGFKLGLEYATDGSMEVNGHKIKLIEKDTQFKPDVARSVLAEAYGDDDALIAVGGTSSGVTTAMLPIAQENEKILLVEPAVADSLTGKDSNRYVFKTSRNSSMDMQAQAIALEPGKDLYVATLAQDYAFGRDGISAFKKALKGTGAHVVDEEYVPQNATDLTATIQRLFDALKDKPGRKVIEIYVAGIDALTSSSMPTPAATTSSCRPAATSCPRWPPTRRCRAWRGRPIITTRRRGTRSTTGSSRNTRSASTRRRTSSPPAACRRRSPWSRRSRRPTTGAPTASSTRWRG